MLDCVVSPFFPCPHKNLKRENTSQIITEYLHHVSVNYESYFVFEKIHRLKHRASDDLLLLLFYLFLLLFFIFISSLNCSIKMSAILLYLQT